jgi:hypothetical protein
VAGGEVVENDDVMARFAQCLDDVTADIPGAAADQYSHILSNPRYLINGMFREI